VLFYARKDFVLIRNAEIGFIDFIKKIKMLGKNKIPRKFDCF